MNTKKPVLYLKTNQFKETNEQQAKRQKTSDNFQILCDNNRFYWKEDNKASTRYICSKKAKEGCRASLTVNKNDVNFAARYSDNHNHMCLSNVEVMLFKAEQELKIKVINLINFFIFFQ